MKEKVENSEITTSDSKTQFSEVMGFHLRKVGGLKVDCH